MEQIGFVYVRAQLND